jgi:hypothetical protein
MSAQATGTPRLVISLERMTRLPPGRADSLVRYVTTIQRQRHDYNRRVLTLRYEDLRVLMILYDKSAADLAGELIQWGVLDPDALSVAPG